MISLLYDDDSNGIAGLFWLLTKETSSRFLTLHLTSVKSLLERNAETLSKHTKTPLLDTDESWTVMRQLNTESNTTKVIILASKVVEYCIFARHGIKSLKMNLVLK